MCVAAKKEENSWENQAERVDRSSAITSQSKCDLFPQKLFQYEQSWTIGRVCMYACAFQGRSSVNEVPLTFLFFFLSPSLCVFLVFFLPAFFFRFPLSLYFHFSTYLVSTSIPTQSYYLFLFHYALTFFFLFTYCSKLNLSPCLFYGSSLHHFFFLKLFVLLCVTHSLLLVSRFSLTTPQ